MNTSKAIYIDTETHKLHGRVIELAYQDFNGGDISCSRFNPEVKIDLQAMMIHHITDFDVKDAPSYSMVAMPAGVEYVIGHNVKYDLDCLAHSQIDCSIYKPICTYALARHILKELPSYKLGYLSYYIAGDNQQDIKVLVKESHCASTDLQLTQKLFIHLISIMESQGRDTSFISLHELTQQFYLAQQLKHAHKPSNRLHKHFKSFVTLLAFPLSHEIRSHLNRLFRKQVI